MNDMSPTTAEATLRLRVNGETRELHARPE